MTRMGTRNAGSFESSVCRRLLFVIRGVIGGVMGGVISGKMQWVHCL